MADISDFMKRAYAYFMDKGYSPQAAASLAGHGDWESVGNSKAVGDKGSAYGLFQWRGGRQSGLRTFAKARGLNADDEDTQLAYTDWELNNTEKASGDALRNASNLTDANHAMMGFLRPQGYTPSNPEAGHGYANRYNNSAALLAQPNMSETYATAPTQNVGPAPNVAAVPADVAASTTPSTPAAGAPAAPVAAAKPKEDPFASLARNGLSLMAQGEAQPIQAPQMQGAPQLHRGDAAPSLLSAVFGQAQQDPNKKRLLQSLLS